MTLKFEGKLHETISDLVTAEQRGELLITKNITMGTVYFKLQEDSFAGNGVWFSQGTANRFSLTGFIKGVMYMADSPHTSLLEAYQGEAFISQADYFSHCLTEIRTERPLQIFDETSLAPQLRIAVGDLMGPKTVYSFTQALATELAKYADGLEYLSRHTGKPCVVLWSDSSDGGGMLSTLSVTPLNKYSYGGKTAKEILKSQLNIRIV